MGSAVEPRPGGTPGPAEPRLGGVGDPERLAALRETGLLDSAPELAFNRLTRLAARLLGVPVAAMSLVDDRRQFFKSAVGLPEPWASRRETPLSHSFCRHVVEREAPFVVDDARAHPLVCDNLAVPELGVRAYLGVPIVTSLGHVLGALCVVAGEARSWSDDEVMLMGELAASVMAEIELRRALAEAKARAGEAERAAGELREREERLRLLADAAFEGIAVSAGGAIVDGNEAFARMFGYARAEFIGMDATAFVAPGERERIARNQREGVEGAYVTTGLRKGGATFPLEVRGRAAAWGGHAARITAMRDLTERVLAEQALARQTAFVGLLRATATEANAATSTEAALRACVARVCRHMGWPVGHAYLTVAGVSGPELAPSDLWHLGDAARFSPFRDATRRMRLPAGVGLAGRVLAGGRAQWLDDVTESAGFLRRDAARASGLRSGFAFPVLVGRDVAAVLEFYSGLIEEPDAALLEVMADVGLQLGRVFEREQARDAVERRAAATHTASVTDELTGLHNRRGFRELAAPLLERANRAGRPALLFFADVNGMKQINDTLGHDAGDEAIRLLATLLRAAFREGDLLARLGGDEFVILVPDAGPELADALRRRMRALVDDHNAASSGRPFRLSVSMGAAAYDPKSPRRLEALLAEADAIMYEQKRLRKLTGASLAPPRSA